MTIVYQSKTGHTRQYAQLLAQATGLTALPLEQALTDLPDGQHVLYMGWLMAGRISGLDRAVKRWAVDCAVGVGMAPAGEQATANLTSANPVNGASLFYLPGGWAPGQVGLFWRLAVNMVTRPIRKSLQNTADRTAEQQAYLDLLTRGGSFVDAKNLSPIVQWCKAYE